MNDTIILPDRASPLAGYPHARRVGDLLFLCGTSSRRRDNTHEGASVNADGTMHLDISEQTHAVIRNMQAILQAAGADLDQLVDITTFLVDIPRDFAGYNAAYNEHFDAATGPARTTVGVRELPHPNLLVEMKAIAYLGSR